MDDKSWLLALFAGSGVLLSTLAVPLIRRKVKPNVLYGFRVPKTLADPRTWYEANAYAGWRLLWTGLVLFFSAIVLYALPQVSMLAYSLTVLVIVTVTLTVTVVQSFIFLRKL